MKSSLLRLSLLLCCAILPLSASAQPGGFSFGVIANTFKTQSDESSLREIIADTDADNLAFVVANGLKSADELCSDDLYHRRKNLLNNAKNGLIVSLTAADWSTCTNANGRPAALGRLNRLREFLFTDELSLGASKLPVTRQSATAKFRSYSENMRWEVSNIMFATINLPSNNNHYIADAGRNNEFEDRIIANRDWLQRLFIYSTNKKLAGIVLFCDANPLAAPDAERIANLIGKRDGFSETRKLISKLAEKFPGKVLLVHDYAEKNAPAPTGIMWRANIGTLEAGSRWVKISVNPAGANIFVLGTGTETRPHP